MSKKQFKLPNMDLLHYYLYTAICINIVSSTQDQITVLMVASYNGKIEVVKELLAAGAHTDIQDNVCQM